MALSFFPLPRLAMSRKKPRRAAIRSAKQVPPIEATTSPRKFRRWLKVGLVGAVLFLPALLAYSDSFHADFTLDNEFIILHNPVVQAATFSNVDLILQHTYWWPKEQVDLYRPVTTLSYLLNYSVLENQENPFGYHLVNSILHFLNVVLVYLLARRLIHTDWLPELIAMTWAVHPVLTESVTNIVGRADLLAGAAILGGFLLYLKSTESSGWARIGCLIGLCTITTVGVFCKENAVALLGVVIAYEATFWKERKKLRAAAWGCFAIIIPILFFLYERARVLASNPPQPPSFLDNPLFGASFLQGRLTALAVMARYIWKLLWPATLSADYSYNQIPLASGTVRDWIAWGVMGAIIVAAVVLYRRNKTAFFFVMFAAVVFLPTSNLLFNLGTIMAERFLYLPAIAFTACLVLTIQELSKRAGVRALRPIAIGLIVAAWGIRTYVRNKDWRDELSLAAASVRASPESYKTHTGLALWLSRTEPIARNIDGAIAEAERALAILKDVPDDKTTVSAYSNAASFYQMKGDLSLGARQSGSGHTDPPEAIHAYQRALEILLEGVRIDKKSSELQRGLEIQRGTPESQIIHAASPNLYIQLGQVYLKLRDSEKAHRTALFARALSPQLPETSLLTAEALASSGRKDESAVALVAGLLITGDKRFLAPLNSLYRNGLDPKGCAFIATANGPFLNNFCEPVHAEICSAYADVIEIYKWNLKQDLADRAKSRAIGEFGCAEQGLGQGQKIQEFP